MPRLADDVHPCGRQQRHGGGGALQAERVASWRPHRLRAQGLPGRVHINLLTRHQVYRLLDGDPGGGGQHDLVRPDDGLPGGGGEERLLGGVRHHEAVRGEGEAAPVCNTRSVSTPGSRTSVTCNPPSSRSVRRFLFLLLMLTEKFPSASSLMGTPGTDDILDN